MRFAVSFGLEALIFELPIQFQSSLGAAPEGESIDDGLKEDDEIKP